MKTILLFNCSNETTELYKNMEYNFLVYFAEINTNYLTKKEVNYFIQSVKPDIIICEKHLIESVHI